MTKVKTKPEIKPKKRKLTRKQKLFVQKYVETNNATEAAAQVYDVANRNVANNIGAENLAKPSIQDELQTIADKAQTLLGNVITDGKVFNKKVGSKEVIDVAKYVHDKAYGKATQVTKNENINFDIDLSTLSGPELVKLKKQTLAK